jgi:dihydropteroate synthase
VRFSAGGPPEPEDVLGERALALEARIDACGSPPAPRADRTRCLFSAAGLAPGVQERLATTPGVVLTPLAGGLTRLESPAALLLELAGELDSLRPLLAAQRNAGLPPGPLRIMGILNTTPDSFSDGGSFLDPGRAIEHGLKLIEAGADILDVGGESTRPGADPVGLAEELERVLPVVDALARDGRAVVSIDTTKSEVAAAAIDAGACIVNDVSAGRADQRMLDLVAEREAGIVLMHRRGTPRDMQRAPSYEDVVRTVTAELRERARAAWRAGIALPRIALDPGIGFGKRLEDNLDLVRALPELRSLGFPLCIGLSRKSFLGQLSGEARPERRSAETGAALAISAYLGAEIHRVHDAAAARAALAVAGGLARRALEGPGRGRG